MREFGKHLLSYSCLLLLPVILLSFVIIQIVNTYCGNMIMEQQKNLLEQVDISVSMQLNQLDVYAVQTGSDKKFFYRNQQQIGKKYEIQKNLIQWDAANAICSKICYMNSLGTLIYAPDAVYTRDSYYEWHLEAQGISQQSYEAALTGNEPSKWLFSEPFGKKLIYITQVQTFPNEESLLICEIDMDVLANMISGTISYDDCCAIIANESGEAMYSYGDRKLSPETLDVLFNAQTETGVVKIDGENNLYSHIHGDHGLQYFTLVPIKTAYGPLNRIWRVFALVLVAIGIIGNGIIVLLMKANWFPVHKLAKDVLGENENDESVSNIHAAVMSMKQNSEEMKKQAMRAGKEQALLRLVMGGYSSAESFNSDNAQAGMEIGSSPWILCVVRCDECFAREEENVSLSDLIHDIYADVPSVFSCKFAENENVLVFMSKEKAGEAEEKIHQAVSEVFSKVEIIWSDDCNDIDQLEHVWHRLLRKVDKGGSDEFASDFYPQQAISAIHDAMTLQLPDRLRFSVDSFFATLRGIHNEQIIRGALYDVCREMQNYCEDRKMFAEASEVRQMNISLSSQSAGIDIRTFGSQLGKIVDSMALSMEKNDDFPELISKINTYLEAHYKYVELNASSVADYFGISLSNLSHYYKSKMGITMAAKIESLRMQEAEKLLLETQKSIAEISEECGYAQPATFMRAFKKTHEITPTAFRAGRK